MLFNSLHFILVFFPVAVTGYYLLPHRFRWFWLLVLSAYFYMAFVPYYILILAVTILVDYAAGLVISTTTGAKRRMWLMLSIVANVGFLAFFKYFAFLRENLLQIGRFAGYDWAIPALSIVLPIGLSFHTFQSMSYTIEVYRGRQEPERNLGIFALYVLFFPQLVAGPIERPQNLLHQFRERHHFDYDAVSGGMKLMVWGLFQKMVIADRLAVMVDRIYAHPSEFGGLTLALGTVLFAFQIFCDFAGYSDVAIGTAQVLGFKLMTNFRQPYLSRSVAEFWKRWHISLSTWFRDYLYLPLGGNRTSQWRHIVNVLVVFAVSGLWHGADWKFVIWGALNGVFVVMAGLRPPGSREEARREAPVLVRRIVTFTLVCCTWVFFRASSLGEAFTIFRRLLPLRPGEVLASIGTAPLICGLGLIVFAMLMHVIRERYSVRELISRQPVWLRWSVYTSALTCILLFGEFHSRDFIYFQF
jgi:D-alanyl-lipoteichoic acid acyltransferase DltB (MBOAT superfamily)